MPPKIRILTLSLLLAFASAGSAQQTIAFVDGPLVTNSLGFDPVHLDVNSDGINDFTLPGFYGLCTADVPTSSCSTTYFFQSLEQTALLCEGWGALVMAAGATIGPEVPANTAWRTNHEAWIAIYSWSERYGTSGWSGPLVVAGSGYIGLRLQAADGLHYGWIFAEMRSLNSPNTLNEPPRYVNWAYETRPNTPIIAGALPILPVEQPRIIRPHQLRLTWATELETAYTIQFKDRFEDFWTSLEITVIGSAANASVDVPILTATRFYRVVRVQ